jgi:hypothetical protein
LPVKKNFNCSNHIREFWRVRVGTGVLRSLSESMLD